MLLNCVASASSSSPVLISIRWPSSPAPIRAAPAWSVWTGVTIRRARKRLATTARATPSSRRITVRIAEA